MAVFPHCTSPTRTSLHLITSGCVFLLSFILTLYKRVIKRKTEIRALMHADPNCARATRTALQFDATDLSACGGFYMEPRQPMKIQHWSRQPIGSRHSLLERLSWFVFCFFFLHYPKICCDAYPKYRSALNRLLKRLNMTILSHISTLKKS